MENGSICKLHYVVGDVECCPGQICPFWEKGGALVIPGCMIEGIELDVETRPGLAEWLLGLRATLEQARDAEEAATALHALNEFLPPGLRD